MSNLPAGGPFRFASSLSTSAELSVAVDEVCSQALTALQGVPDLAVLFVSADRTAQAEYVATAACKRLGTERLIGCTGESLAGVNREVESQPALSLWVAKLPGASVLPMHLSFVQTAEGDSLLGWPDELLSGWPPDATLLLLGDPFTFPADWLLETMNRDQPGVRVVGGMASGGQAPGENRLFWGPRAIEAGAVGVVFSGALRVRTLVSQGCRPIGKRFVITKAERNVIYELGGQPAVLQLNEIFECLPTREQELVRQGLHLGRVVSEYQDRYEMGDFLVRNVLGADPANGALIIGDYVRVGQTVQFHIRDWESADAELRQLLGSLAQARGTAPAGALLFTCNGRGTRLFPEPHHDAAAVGRALGPIPLAGFFAQGELGPVGGKNFMHGFTASLAVFEQRDA